MNYTALRIRSTTATKSCCTIHVTTAEIKGCYQFLQIIHTPPKWHLAHYCFKTTVWFPTLCELTFYIAIPDSNCRWIGRHGMTWLRKPTATKGCKAKARRSTWMEELLCSGVPIVTHNFVSSHFFLISLSQHKTRFLSSSFTSLFQQQLPLYFITWFTQHEDVYLITHHQAIWSKW